MMGSTGRVNGIRRGMSFDDTYMLSKPESIIIENFEKYPFAIIIILQLFVNKGYKRGSIIS